MEEEKRERERRTACYKESVSAWKPCAFLTRNQPCSERVSLHSMGVCQRLNPCLACLPAVPYLLLCVYLREREGGGGVFIYEGKKTSIEFCLQFLYVLVFLCVCVSLLLLCVCVIIFVLFLTSKFYWRERESSNSKT